MGVRDGFLRDTSIRQDGSQLAEMAKNMEMKTRIRRIFTTRASTTAAKLYSSVEKDAASKTWMGQDVTHNTADRRRASATRSPASQKL